MLEEYAWPGNVRQLINTLEHSAITCKSDTVEVSDLPEYVFQEKKAAVHDRALDRDKLLSSLAQFKGNRTLTAKHLGISRVTLWKKLKDHKIE